MALASSGISISSPVSPQLSTAAQPWPWPAPESLSHPQSHLSSLLLHNHGPDQLQGFYLIQPQSHLSSPPSHLSYTTIALNSSRISISPPVSPQLSPVAPPWPWPAPGSLSHPGGRRVAHRPQSGPPQWPRAPGRPEWAAPCRSQGRSPDWGRGDPGRWTGCTAAPAASAGGVASPSPSAESSAEDLCGGTHHLGVRGHRKFFF